MPSTKLPKFEDWTRPWADGEFDEEKAARLVYGLTKDKQTLSERNASLTSDNEELQTKLTASDDKVTDLEASASRAGTTDSDKDAKITTLERQVRDLERDKGKISPDIQARIDRLEVANDLGLTTEDAERLRGKTKDEVLEDGKKFAARLGIKPREELDGSEGDDGDGGMDFGSQSFDGRVVREGESSGAPQRGVRRATDFTTGTVQGRTYNGDTSKVLAGLPPL